MDMDFFKISDGYRESISKGIAAMQYFKGRVKYGTGDREEQLQRLKNEIRSCDAILIGAGAGLSTSAGLSYSGERFDKYFFDFGKAFGIKDIYSGGFYPFPKKEIFWHGGQGIFTLTDMLMRQNLYIRTYLNWLRIRTIL